MCSSSVRIAGVASQRSRPASIACSSGRAAASQNTSQSSTTWVSTTSHGVAHPLAAGFKLFNAVT